MYSLSKLFKIELAGGIVVALVAICFVVSSTDAKLLRRSRYYDDIGSGYDGPYGGGGGGGVPMATGERAILTVRGARSPYDGSAPAKILIEDNPYRGPYPRGVYDRLDGYGGAGRAPMYPRMDPYNYGPGSYGGRMNGYGPPMYGAPNRIAVTGAYPYGYGSRF